MAVGVTVAFAGPAMCSASSAGVDNCSGNRAKLAATSSVVVSGAAGTCGSFHLMNVLLNADDSGMTNVERQQSERHAAVNAVFHEQPHARQPAQHANQFARPSAGRRALGSTRGSSAAESAATIVPKKLCPNPCASTYA